MPRWAKELGDPRTCSCPLSRTVEDVVTPSCPGDDVGLLTGSALPPGMIWNVPRKAKEVGLLLTESDWDTFAILFEILCLKFCGNKIKSYARPHKLHTRCVHHVCPSAQACALRDAVMAGKVSCGPGTLVEHSQCPASSPAWFFFYNWDIIHIHKICS